MLVSPLGNTHGRKTSSVAWHHLLWTAHTVERLRAQHAITAFGKHTRSNDVGHGMPSSPLGSTNSRTASGVACHHRPCIANTIERCRVWHASSPLGSIHGRTTSGVACHQGPWIAHTVERRRAWHAIISLEWQTRLNDVGRGIHYRLWTSLHSWTV